MQPENLLIGLLRIGGPPLYIVNGRLDVEHFHAELAERLAPAEGEMMGEELPMSVEAQEALDAAIGLAASRRHESAYGLHLLHALTRDSSDPLARLLRRFGASSEVVNADLTAGL